MTTEARAAFARRLNVNRSTVTRWAETGRIVLAGDGVEVEASLRRLQETGGARPDVAARHAEGRAGKVGAGDTAPPAASAPSAESSGDRIGNSYQAARAVKEKYSALKAKADYEQQIGNLIPRDDVDAALRTFAASVRARLDVMPDQLAPLVAPVTDLGEAHAILAGHARAMLAEVAADLAKAAQVAAQGESQPRLDGA